MILYHYTAREFLPSIMAEGLSLGEVPVTFSPENDRNAVWLTNDTDPAGHGLTGGGPATPEYRLLKGVPAGIDLHFPNKREVRLDVLIPRGDRALVAWPRWARKRLSDAWLLSCIEI